MVCSVLNTYPWYACDHRAYTGQHAEHEPLRWCTTPVSVVLSPCWAFVSFAVVSDVSLSLASTILTMSRWLSWLIASSSYTTLLAWSRSNPTSFKATSDIDPSWPFRWLLRIFAGANGSLNKDLVRELDFVEKPRFQAWLKKGRIVGTHAAMMTIFCSTLAKFRLFT